MSLNLRHFAFKSSFSKANLSHWVAVGLCFSFVTGISHLVQKLKQKTDETAWIEYRQAQVHRAPAEAQVMSAGLNQFRNELDAISVRRLLIGCLKSSSLEQCYREQLDKSFESTFKYVSQRRGQQGLADVHDAEKALFLGQNEFEKVFAEVKAFHENLLQGLQHEVELESSRIFEMCKSQGEKNELPSEFSFTQDEPVFLKNGVFLCLSGQWVPLQDHALDLELGRIGIVLETPQARDWLKAKTIEPWVHQTWSRWIDQESRREKSEFSLGLSEWAFTQKNELLADFKWFEVEETRSLPQLCLASALDHGARLFGEKYSFLDLKQQMATAITPICDQLSKNPLVLNAFHQSQRKMFDKKIEEWLPALDSYVVAQANQKKEECESKNSKEGSQSLSSCIFPSWVKWVEQPAIQNWTQSSELKNWVSRNPTGLVTLNRKASQYLAEKRLILQQEVLPPQ